MGKASARCVKFPGLSAALLTLAATIPIDTVDARITRIVIDKRTPALEGAAFGAVGPYEQLDGTAYGEIDPRDPLNGIIQDVELAPRNARGMVEYSMGISILKPVDMSKGNRTLLYETVNRGRKNLPNLNIGGDGAKAGDGFLQREGYTLAWSGWQGDITTGLKIALPVAVNPDGSPITGRVRAEYTLDESATTVDVTARPAYEAASLDNAGAVLTRRVRQADARETIDNSKWAFADCATTPFPGKPNAAKVCVDGGFDTNHIYELVYTAKNPTVAGMGLAATRDFAAFLRDSAEADPAAVNPVAGGIDNALIFGSSQSGRWIRTFIHLGFNESESHKKVFDGAIPHKASNRGAFNVRWAQATRLSGTQHTEAQYPGQESPQTWDVSTDPIAGVTGGQLERCRKSQTCPKITATYTDTEYWQSLMALNTTDATGEKDVTIPREVRLYFLAGTQHSGGDPLRQPPSAQPKPPLACQLPANVNSFFPAQRALLVALRDWIVSGKEPPASVYPTIARKSLVSLADVKLPYVPASGKFSTREVAAQRVHLDRGTAFREADITGVMAEPPRIGAAYPLLLPQVDADGNPIDGLRNTAVQVPLGTYTGWNVRKAGFGEGDSCDLLGSFIPFFRTKAERVAAEDPRPSLEERYPTHDVYVEKVSAAAARLVADRFLLAQDADLLVSQAKAAAIP